MSAEKFKAAVVNMNLSENDTVWFPRWVRYSSSLNIRHDQPLPVTERQVIAAFLRENGYGKEILVRGLSSARSEEGANASGRVDIIILRDNGLERELLMIEQP